MLVLLLLAQRACAQSPSTARASGNCSPAISGSKVGNVTITCSALSPDKADQLIRLMNRILQDHIDPDVIYKQLDELRTQVGHLDVAMNPLAHADPRSAELATRGNQLYQGCTNLLSRWNAENSDARQAATESYDTVKGHLSLTDYWKEAESSVAAKWLPVFSKDLKIKMGVWRAEVIAAEPDLGDGYPEPGPIHSVTELSQACTSVGFLDQRYYQHVIQAIQLPSAHAPH